MIKFFRTIRKSHLMENKISKYFKYATAENLAPTLKGGFSKNVPV